MSLSTRPYGTVLVMSLTPVTSTMTVSLSLSETFEVETLRSVIVWDDDGGLYWGRFT
jgi:hypothetical protein